MKDGWWLYRSLRFFFDRLLRFATRILIHSSSVLLCVDSCGRSAPASVLACTFRSAGPLTAADLTSVSTEGIHSANWKWGGITAVGAMVYAAPYNVPTVPWPGLQHWSALDSVLEGRTVGILFGLVLDTLRRCIVRTSIAIGLTSQGNLGFFRDNRSL